MEIKNKMKSVKEISKLKKAENSHSFTYDSDSKSLISVCEDSVHIDTLSGSHHSEIKIHDISARKSGFSMTEEDSLEKKDVRIQSVNLISNQYLHFVPNETTNLSISPSGTNHLSKSKSHLSIN